MTKSRAGAVALVILAPALATALAWVLDRWMSVAGLSLVYVLAVLAASTWLGRWGAIGTSFLCVCALNYFFVPPRFTFQVDGAEYWWTLAVLGVVSLGLNMLIANLRLRRTQAERAMACSAQLHGLAQLLARSADAARMCEDAAQWFHEQFSHPCAVFLRSEEEGSLQCLAMAGSAGFEEKPAQWALEHRRPLGRGCPDWPQLPLWCAPFSRQHAAGAVQLLLPADVRPDEETLDHWQALVRQTGLCVERELATAAARAAREQARAEAVRNTLLASLSHDLRTPLAGILGSASALRAQGAEITPPQRERLLQSLESEALDMTLMADNILQMARMSQPGWRPGLEWESLEEILGTAVQRLRRRWPQARIQWRVPRELPPVQLEGGLLAQVVANLVDNALRHGGAQAEVVVQAGRSRGGVFVAVRDHGPGLPAGGEARLFDAYARGHDGATAGGTGLGLAICKTIVEAHGGRIQAVRCEPGCEFRFDLPLAAQPAPESRALA